jgi:hypothetical protein
MQLRPCGSSVICMKRKRVSYKATVIVFAACLEILQVQLCYTCYSIVSRASNSNNKLLLHRTKRETRCNSYCEFTNHTHVKFMNLKERSADDTTNAMLSARAPLSMLSKLSVYAHDVRIRHETDYDLLQKYTPRLKCHLACNVGIRFQCSCLLEHTCCSFV